MWRITAFDRDGRRITGIEVDGGEVTIGRDADRQLVLPSASVSRKHARLVLSGPQPFVADEGSANGVLVNGQRIGQPTAVLPGVRVDIAEFYLELEQPLMTEAVAPISDRPPASFDPSDVVRLLATGGPFDGRIYDVPPGEMGVGRAMDNELVLDDPSLSRKHAKIRRAGVGRIEIEDLNSSNGSYVNGRKVGRGTAGPGDTVRFGDLIFRLQGSRADGTRAITPQGGSKAWILFTVIGVLVVGAGAATAFVFLKKPPGPGKDQLTKIADQAAEHVKLGKSKLADKKFADAAAEFEQAIDLDPSNSDARRLKALAEGEPQNEKFAKQVSVKVDLGDRKSLESAARFLNQIPEDSVFREPSSKKLSLKLVSFGQGECKSKRWADCAWAVCKAYEVAPGDARPPSDAAALLADAEKKLAKDKSGYTKCKAKR